MSAGFRSPATGLGASADPVTTQAGLRSLLGPLGGGAPAVTTQAGMRSLFGPLGGGAVATGGVAVTPEVIQADISAAFVTEFEGAKLSPAQRRKLDEYKKGIWIQLGRRNTTRTYARWYARQEARRLRRRLAA